MTGLWLVFEFFRLDGLEDGTQDESFSLEADSWDELFMEGFTWEMSFLTFFVDFLAMIDWTRCLSWMKMG